MSVAGGAVDLPVQVSESIFGSSTTCLMDLPFSVDVMVPLVLQEVGDSAVEVLGVGTPEFNNITVDVSATGEQICTFFAALKDLIIDVLVGQVEGISGQLLEEVSAAFVGLVICRP